jgi:hypothetical protein
MSIKLEKEIVSAHMKIANDVLGHGNHKSSLP